MNNSQFRDLVQNDKSTHAARGSPAFKPPMLGSRVRPSAPMTPRSVARHNPSKDFARQVDDHTRHADGQPALKKFRSSSAPKGTKLAEGYEDRTSLRRQHEEEQSGREKKLRELEEMVKKEKIDQATFERLRDQMGVGGDLGSTHLVKGLDRKLLERVRRGDDLNAAPTKEINPVLEEGDSDEELDSVLDKDVAAKQKVQTRDVENAQEIEPGTPQAMTRDEILRRLKESRTAKFELAPIPNPVLSGRFKKLPSAEKPAKKKFVETINGRRREVLIVIDKNGNTKRKTRWIDSEDAVSAPKVTPLGMEVPAELAAKQKALLEQEAAEDENEDIFQGVGADYDPLKGINSDSEDDEDKPPGTKGDAPGDVGEMKPRNYFSKQETPESFDNGANPLTQDPTILATLKRAAAIRQNNLQDGSDAVEERDSDQMEKRKQFLAKLKQQERQDAEDMDLGFGESRFADDDDEEGPIWEGDEERGGKKRKRGPKKRKGDKDNVADVMSVIDGRKKS